MFEIMPVSLSCRSAADASRFLLIRAGYVIDTLVRERKLGFDINFWDCRSSGMVRLTRSFVVLDC